jgi:predicted PurR-regulated permease PerM
VSHHETPSDIGPKVPTVLRVGAAISWRLLILLVAIGVVAYLIGYLAVVTVPVAIALLLSALFAPVVAQLTRWRVPKSLATAIAVVLGLAVVGGVVTLFVSTFSTGVPELRSQVSASIEQIRNWLSTGPLHITQEQMQGFLNDISRAIKSNQSLITTGALNTAATVGEALTGFLLCLFTLIFFLHDGRTVWEFLIKIVPAPQRDRVDVAGQRGFASLVSYVRATVAVAVVDALGIGIGLLIVGVPLVVPLAALVFLGAFIPIVGAVIAGVVAVLVALVTNGFLAAVIVLAIVIAVMQLESHVLQPLLMGRAVKLHPLSVVLGVAAGVVIAGIAGALLAVPLLAVANSGIRSLLHEPEVDPDDLQPAIDPSETAIPATPDPDSPETEDGD